LISHFDLAFLILPLRYSESHLGSGVILYFRPLLMLYEKKVIKLRISFILCFDSIVSWILNSLFNMENLQRNW